MVTPISRDVDMYGSTFEDAVIPVLMRSRCDLDKSKLRNVYIHNFHLVKQSPSSQKVAPLSGCYTSAQSWNNKALSVADSEVFHGMDVLALTEIWL